MQKPNSFYCAKKGETIELNFGFKYNIIEKIGQGSYGEVFKIFDLEKLRLLIVKRHKTSKSRDGISLFETEHEILSQISKHTKQLYVGEYVKEPTQEYFYMDCLGSNIEDLVSKFKSLSVKTVKHIGLKVLEQLQVLHSMGYLHRDIKTQNILIGNQDTLHNIYLIDYGLALKYKNNGVQIPKRKYQGLVGTARYASLTAHSHWQQSPRDDLQSLGYVLLFCLQGSLSWMNLDIEDKAQKFQKIEQLKRGTSIKDLGFNFPFLIRYFKYAKELKYEDKPDYEYLKGLFKPVMKADECFEWCETRKCKCRANTKFSDANVEQNIKIPVVTQLKF